MPEWGVGWECVGVSGGWGVWKAQHYCLSAVSSDAGLLWRRSQLCPPHTHTHTWLPLLPRRRVKMRRTLSPVKGSGLLPNSSQRQCQFVSVCVCSRVYISVWLLNKLFLIVGEECRPMRRLLFQRLPNFQPLTFTCTNHHYYNSCVFSYHPYSEFTLSFVLLCCLLLYTP